MGEPGMKWFFAPRRDADEDRPAETGAEAEAGQGGPGQGGPGQGGPGQGGPGQGGAGREDDDSSPGLTGLPADLLERHGALVLNPAAAAAIPDGPTPRPTVYRARTLLVPDDLLRERDFVEAANAVLADVGMRLRPPARGPDRDYGRMSEQGAEVLRRLPRPVVLVPADRADRKTPLPVVIDAWLALQALRAAATPRAETAPGTEAEPDRETRLDRQAVDRIALEHLLLSSAIGGSPISGSNGLGGSPISGSNGLAGSPASTGSYLYAGGGDSRAPVTVCLDAPTRQPAEVCAKACGRRPVVAVLDTGMRAHPWLDVRPGPAAGGPPAASSYLTDPNDGFVAVDPGMQGVIFSQAQAARTAGDQPRQLIEYAWDTPVTADPLVGELDTDTGHCTFIAGIVRQVAPDAQVLAIRITHSDGVVYQGDLICALSLLAERVAAASAPGGDPRQMVDVLSLSLGYFSESAADVTYSCGLWQVIELLLSLGVVVVAAAGNYSTSRRFYPAAFAEWPTPPGLPPLISVGALNPNGSKALFSDGGRWITAWASGAAMVSTFPVDLNGSRSPELRMRAHPGNELPPGVQLPPERAALDLDDFRGGHATWSGTSFSAPLLAAHIARSLLEIAAKPALGPKLDAPGAQAAKDRAMAALKNLQWPG
jgi:hypothetical protein